jgi:glycine betaine catabolism B
MGEWSNWLHDLGSYSVQMRKRLALRKPKKGVDYTSAEYADAVHGLVKRLHPEKMQLTVVEIIDETPTTKTFRCERTDGEIPPFRAGQYVNLYLVISGVHTSRPYSISSPPGRNHLDLTVRRKPGGFLTGQLFENVKIGDVWETSGPAGQFYYEPLIDRGELVFIAGGSGVTPFISMLRDQERKGWPFKIHMLYGSRMMEDVIFKEELERLANSSDNFNYSLVISEPPEEYDGHRGFITRDLIREHIGENENKTFFICGPNALYDFCLAELEALGAPLHKIRRELYGPPDDVTKEPGWPEGVAAGTTFQVKVEGFESFEVSANEPLINSLERNGVKVRNLCRSGECSYCRVQLVAGDVFMPTQTGVRESDAFHGYIHACVSYPVSDVQIRL